MPVQKKTPSSEPKPLNRRERRRKGKGPSSPQPPPRPKDSGVRPTSPRDSGRTFSRSSRHRG